MLKNAGIKQVLSEQVLNKQVLSDTTLKCRSKISSNFMSSVNIEEFPSGHLSCRGCFGPTRR